MLAFCRRLGKRQVLHFNGISVGLAVPYRTCQQKSRPVGGGFRKIRRAKTLLDLGFLELDMPAHNRIVFGERELLRLGAGILLGDIEETGIGCGEQLDLDIGGLGHGGTLGLEENRQAVATQGRGAMMEVTLQIAVGLSRKAGAGRPGAKIGFARGQSTAGSNPGLESGSRYDTVVAMTKLQKLLARMRNNPRGWRIEDIISLASRHGIDWRQPGTSHVTFSFPGLIPVTVPAHKPVKPVYVLRFVALLDQIGETGDE